MICTPRRLASEITEFSAVASAGLMMIAFAPDEIRLRIAAICSGAAPFWLATRTLDTLPLARACALTAQIISSRQPLPTSVLDTPRTYFLPPLDPLPLEPELELLSLPLPQAPTPTAAASAISTTATGLLRGPMLLLLTGLQHAREPARVLCVGTVEQLGRAAAPDDGRTGDDGGQRAMPQQRRRRPHLELVGQRHGRDRRTRADRRVEPLEAHQCVAGRRAEVEHDVGVVEQPGARRVAGLARPRGRDRGDADHRQAA